MTYELPWPPSVNHYWLQSRNGGRYISRDGERYRTEVILIVRQAGVVRFASKDRIAVKIAAYPPDARARDLDNILKSLLDALQHAGCYDNDSQIDDLHVIRGERVEDGAIVVTIEKNLRGGEVGA